MLQKKFLKRKKKRQPTSEYGRELLEKQELRKIYGIRERQFRGYVKDILAKRASVEDASLELIRKLEKRLDNVIYRLGFAKTRAQARQLVTHGHFQVNQKNVDIPSYQVRKGDKISLKENKRRKEYYKKISYILDEEEVPSWLRLDKKNMSAEIVGEPVKEETEMSVEIPSIFEFYSR